MHKLYWMPLALCVLTQAAAAQTGEQVFLSHCAGCHQLDGTGQAPWIPAITRIVRDRDSTFLIRALLDGQFRRAGEVNGHTIPVMPSWSRLSNQEIASLITYISQRFGGHNLTVSAQDVEAIRHQTP